MHLFSLCCLVHTKKQHSPGCSFFPYRPNKQQNVPEGTLKENFPKKRRRITALWDKHTAFLLRNTLRILKGMQKKIGNKKHMLRTWTAVRKGDDFESCICFALKLYAAFILLMNYMHAKSYMTAVRISNCNGFMCLRNIVFHFQVACQLTVILFSLFMWWRAQVCLDHSQWDFNRKRPK